MDDDTAPIDDESLFEAVVDRLTPEEITHTLTKSPHWDDERAGDVAVFTPRDGGDPVVYDPDAGTFLPGDAYDRTMVSVERAVRDENALHEMLSEVDGTVERRDVLMHFNSTGQEYRGRSGSVTAIGFAVDGEGYTLARLSGAEPGTAAYGIVRSTYTTDGVSRDVLADRLTVDRSDVPDQHDFFHTKVAFLDDHLLSRYSDTREESLARIEEEYSRAVDL